MFSLCYVTLQGETIMHTRNSQMQAITVYHIQCRREGWADWAAAQDADEEGVKKRLEGARKRAE
jgi:hypothetical protein